MGDPRAESVFQKYDNFMPFFVKKYTIFPTKAVPNYRLGGKRSSAALEMIIIG